MVKISTKKGSCETKFNVMNVWNFSLAKTLTLKPAVCTSISVVHFFKNLLNSFVEVVDYVCNRYYQYLQISFLRE